ncbi:hypothetical protein BASA81_005641 [Batrachochytrium salamandrivorans]|nr:hypothetical protein BASA81_005641 [Batrachochytrium salamandrivorans]
MKWLVALGWLLAAVVGVWAALDEDDVHGFDEDESTATTTQAKVFSINPFQVEISIAYCGVGGAGQQAFDQVKQFLESRFPDQLTVTGKVFPLTIQAQIALAASRVAQAVGTVFALAGPQIMGWLGVGNHPLAQTMLNRKMQFLAVTFLMSTAGQNYAKTEAFEIYINGDRVFSKLEQQRMPSFDELARFLQDHGVAVAGSSPDQYQSLHAKSM